MNYYFILKPLYSSLPRMPKTFRAAVSASEPPFLQSHARAQWTNGDQFLSPSPPARVESNHIYSQSLDHSWIPVSRMATPNVLSSQSNPVMPKSHVGFDSITTQIERKLLKRGFQFNIICVGQCLSCGLGWGDKLNKTNRANWAGKIHSHQHHIRFSSHRL